VLGVLCASVISAVTGYLWLRWALPARNEGAGTQKA
jgi:Na+/H+ antiporter NhaA